jgi:hypothetical protein
MLKLIDRLTIGDYNVKKDSDFTKFVWEFERELILHEGRGYKMFVRWKDKTRLKDLLSNGSRKKIWRYFGRLLMMFKEKRS